MALIGVFQLRLISELVNDDDTGDKLVMAACQVVDDDDDVVNCSVDCELVVVPWGVLN